MAQHNTPQALIDAVKAIELPHYEWDKERKELVETTRPILAFVGDDGVLHVSAENGDGAADYYGELVTESRDEKGEIVNAFGICQQLHDAARAHGYYWEWDDAGSISAWEV